MKRRSSLYAYTTFGACLLAIGGCGGHYQLSDAEIGKPIYTLPTLPGADRPYPMPELDQPANEAPADKEKPADKEQAGGKDGTDGRDAAKAVPPSDPAASADSATPAE